MFWPKNNRQYENRRKNNIVLLAKHLNIPTSLSENVSATFFDMPASLGETAKRLLFRIFSEVEEEKPDEVEGEEDARQVASKVECRLASALQKPITESV